MTSTLETEEGIERNIFKLSKRRWAILALLTFLQVLSGITFSCFGQISNFYVALFHVTFAQADWLTVAYDVAPVAFTLPLAWLTYRKTVGFRSLALFCSLAFNAAFACIAISLTNDSLFWLSVVGQTIAGAAAQVLMATPSIFAVVWFPDNEVGTAISVNLMGLFAGYVVGGILPTKLLAFSRENYSRATLMNDRNTLLAMFCACFVATVTISLSLCLIASDAPTNPPNASQHMKRTEGREDTSHYWSNTFKLLKHKTFILVSVVFGAIFQAQTVEFTMMSQILGEKIQLDTDAIGGYVIAFYGFGCVLGTVPAALLINRYKRYRLISIVSSWMVFLSATGIALGVIFSNIASVYACNVAMGAVSQMAMVALYGVITEATQPMDETFVTLWFAGIMIPTGIIYNEASRALFDGLGGEAAILFQAVCMLMGAILSCFFAATKVPSLRDNSDSSSDEADEGTKLLRQQSIADEG